MSITFYYGAVGRKKRRFCRILFSHEVYCMLLADIQMSGDGSAWEEVGGAGAWLSLVVRGGAAETLLHQNSSHLAHWQAQLHVDAHAQASLHFTFTNSCGLFLGERERWC
jgi:hypothetical protein